MTYHATGTVTEDRTLPAIVYGPSPTGMGSFDEHVTVEEFLHVVKCHVLSAYNYMSRPG